MVDSHFEKFWSAIMQLEAQPVAKPERQRVTLVDFAVRTAILTVAAVVLIFSSVVFFESMLRDQFAPLKGGHIFWTNIESKLYKLADEPDVNAEQKKKILAALQKLSVKYKPYFDALSGSQAQIKSVSN